MTTLEQALSEAPLIAILRGVQPYEVVAIGEALYHAGFRCIEVPLNSPDPFVSIGALSQAIPHDCIIGAGTVLTVDDVAKVRDAGGRIVVTPNTDPEVIRATLAAGLIVTPGVGTATEAFAAAEAGATHLKLFPASSYGISHLQALRSVLPEGTRILAVGGVGAAEIAEWQQAGAAGFGIGSELYRAGDSVERVSVRARKLIEAVD